MLSASTRMELENALRDFEEKTSNQVVVVTFSSLEGESLEDFSIRLAEQWKVGKKGRDNGVILLIFQQDRKLRIETGYGLEGPLNDAVSSSIIRNKIAPFFKAGQFDEGVRSGVLAIFDAIKGEYVADSTQGSLSPIFILFFILFIFGFFAFLIFASKKGWMQTSYSSEGYHSDRSSSSWGSSSSWSSSSSGGFSSGGGSFGGGGSSGSW
ncbi:MAG: TPM domain-containing protein [Deltaproteobacteria bacterium]|nr:TPM domain-containing protein [Deltaproteobacteria bacterium]